MAHLFMTFATLHFETQEETKDRLMHMPLSYTRKKLTLLVLYMRKKPKALLLGRNHPLSTIFLL